MIAVVVVLAVIAGAGSIWLTESCWTRQAVLAAGGGLIGMPFVVFAATDRFTGGMAVGTLVIALIFQLVGTLLLYGGQLLEHLLDDDPDPVR